MLYYKHMRCLDVAKNIKRSILFLAAAVFIVFTFTLFFTQTAQAATYVEPSSKSCKAGYSEQGNKDSGYWCLLGATTPETIHSIECPAGSKKDTVSAVTYNKTRCESTSDSGSASGSSSGFDNNGSPGSRTDYEGTSGVKPDATCPGGYLLVKGSAGGWYCQNENNPRQVAEAGSMTCPEGSEKTTIEDSSVSVTTYACSPSSSENKEDGPTCGVDGIGWIVCPLLTFVANINDVAYDAIAHFLKVDIGLFNNSSKTYQAWQPFRNLANGIFAILFLWIIFSQISSVGVSNYGIKKMLPRLIIGALLVNVSFYLCQIAVDLSNILGSSLKDMLDVLAGQATNDTTAGIPTWSKWISGALATVGAGIFILLAVGIPTILFALLAIMLVFIIMLARQAVIVLLIVVSPLAFAAWLLPNTEGLFKKWLNIFKAMLVIYPVVALLFGSGTLASFVLYNIAVGASDDTDKNTLMIAALGVSVVPLIAVIPAIQNSLKSLGSFGEKLAGLSKRAGGGTSKSVKSRFASSGVGQRINEFGKNAERKRAMRVARRRTGKIGAKIDRSRLGRAMGFDRGSYAAQSALDEEAVKSGQSAFLYGEHKGNPVAALKDKDEFVRLAAMDELSKSAWGVGQLRNHFSEGGKIGNVQQAKLLEGVKSRDVGVASIATEARNRFSSGNTAPVGAKDISPDSDNDRDAINTITARKFGGLSHEQMASQITDSLRASQIDAATAAQLLNDRDLRHSMSGDNRALLASIAAPTTAPSQSSQNTDTGADDIPVQPQSENNIPTRPEIPRSTRRTNNNPFSRFRRR